MKAVVKATGEIVDVVFENTYVKDGVKISVWTDGKKEYSKQSLNFNYSDMPSKRYMRYELTKDIAQGLCTNLYPILNRDYETIAEESIRLADEIIKKLKE